MRRGLSSSWGFSEVAPVPLDLYRSEEFLQTRSLLGNPGRTRFFILTHEESNKEKILEVVVVEV